MYICNTVFLSQDWWIENNLAWFVSADEGYLMNYDFDTSLCTYITAVPDVKSGEFRRCSVCMKYEKEIVCLPDTSDSIFLYSLTNRIWTKVNVPGGETCRLSCNQFTLKENLLYIYSRGLMQILVLDLDERQIINVFSLSSENTEVLGFGTFKNNFFYTVSSAYSQIYELNLINGSIFKIDIPCIKSDIETISQKDDCFILCGRKKVILLFDKKKNKLQVINEFPKEFGTYRWDNANDCNVDCLSTVFQNRIFYCTVVVGDNIWCIPYETNKVLYFNLSDKKVNTFDISEENETKESLLLSRMKHKYILLYVKDDRFIGLYSCKNEWIIEIDTATLQYRFLTCIIDDNCMIPDRIYYEKRRMDCALFEISFEKMRDNTSDRSADTIGKRIYESISTTLH